MPPRRVLTSTEAFPDKTLSLNIWSVERREWILQPFPVARINMYYQFLEVYKSVDSPGYHRSSMNITALVMQIPLQELVIWFKFLSLKNLRRLCDMHTLTFWSNNKQQLADQLISHQCSAFCGESHIVIFKPLSTPRSAPTFSVSLEAPSNLPAPTPLVENSLGAVPLTGGYDHLQVLTEEQKVKLLADWHDATSTLALQVVVCAACGRKIFASQSKTVHNLDKVKKMLGLLCNPSLPDFLSPTNYSFQQYYKAILHYKGLLTPQALGPLQLCNQCFNSLENSKMPRLALANDLYTGHDALPTDVSDAFNSSTVAERMLISRARFNSICCKFNGGEDEKDSKKKGKRRAEDSTAPNSMLANARKGLKGNVIVVPLDTVRMRSLIPPPASTIRDTLCAVFVGATKPDANDILTSRKTPLLVRRSRVKTMIDFLLEHNAQYRPRPNYFGFSPENMDGIFRDGQECIPPSVEIGVMNVTDAVEVSTADYTPRNELSDTGGRESQLLMENVGYTDGDTSAVNYKAMKAFAVERCRRGKPFIATAAGNTPLPDFHNPNILTWLFPHLDPWGIVGFNHVKRRVKLTLEEQLRYFLQLDDPRYQSDPEFAFVFFNVVRKMHVAQSVRFSAKPSTHHRLATDLMSIDPQTLERLGKKFQYNPLYTPSEPEEHKAHDVISSLSMLARQIPGSNGYKVNLRNQIRAMINVYGTPTLFITLNPADVDNPIVRLLSGENISLEDIARGEDMKEFTRKIFAAEHPGPCALFFHVMMTSFITVALRYKSNPPEPGVFGFCDAYYGTVEAQGKGTLHCHMLLWIRGHLSPQKLRDEMANSTEYTARVVQWVESVIHCEFPRLSPSEGMASQPLIRIRHSDVGNPHPGTMPAPLKIARTPHGAYDWSEYNFFLSQLLIEYNWHVHNDICWKYLRRHEPRNDQTCRLRMNGITRELTSLDSETGALLIRRHHPYIAAYNDLITTMFKSNTEVKFIGSGQAARDLVFYITDYVTKPTLPLHVGMAALQYAIEKVNNNMAGSPNCYTDGMNIKTVTTAVNSMMGRHEISQPQVLSYLIGGGDHYTSEQFSTLNWGHVLAFVDSQLHRPENPASPPSVEAEPAESLHMSMNVDIRADSITVSNQTLDYMFRSAAAPFHDICLYDFVSYVSKAAIPRTLLRDGNIENITGSFSSWEHPQRGTHFLRCRQVRHVPVLLGPSIPNPQSSAENLERWAKYIIILFKPWRDPSSIKDSEQTWLQAYESYKSQISDTHSTIIQNMNAFAESKDARGSAPIRSRATDEPDYNTTFAFNPQGESPDGDAMSISDDGSDGMVEDDAGEPMDIYLCTDRTSRHSSMLNHIAGQRLGCEVVQSLDLCHPDTSMDVDDCDFDDPDTTEPTEDDLENIATYEDFMKRQKIKRTANCASSGTPPVASYRPTIQPFVEIMEIDTEDELSKSFPLREEGLTVSEIITSVIAKMNLESNPEQLKAFNIVADHLIMEDKEQLLMYVSGVGGTGKSHVIKSIVQLFLALGVRKQLLLGAPTGIAAVLINGQTLHSLALINAGGRNGNLEDLTSIWQDVRYLIIDEVSMIGALFLSQLSNRMREAKYHHPESCNLPFGGVNVIFMGDFGQLKPAVQSSLYAHSIVKHPSFRTATSVDGISAMNGAFLWRQVTTVVQLVRNQRQLGDPLYASFLLRIRLGICTPHPSNLTISSSKTDWTYILERVLTNLDRETLLKFELAPVIVGNKVTRDMLNALAIMHHSTKIRRKVSLYHSVDTLRRVPVPRGIRKTLWNIRSADSKDAFGRLPIFCGMRVMITENVMFSHNIVNGCEGVVKKVVFKRDEMGFRTLIMVFVHIPGCGINLHGLSADIVPISPVSTRIQHSIRIGRKKVQKGFTRRQVPLVPAYAYTDYKSQGRTLSYVVVDLYTARGQGVYVMLSRVTSISGLAILRWFPANKIYSRISAELRDELSRLDGLSLN